MLCQIFFWHQSIKQQQVKLVTFFTLVSISYSNYYWFNISFFANRNEIREHKTFNHKELFFSFTSHTQCFCFFSVNFLSFFFFVALKQNALFDERTWPPINRALSSYLSSRDLWKPPKHYGHWLQLKKMKRSLNWHHLFSVFIRIVMFKFLSKFEWVRNQK